MILCPKNLQFDPQTHQYTLDGKKMVSVTQVVHSIQTGRFDFVTPSARQAGADLGRLVHDMCAEWCKSGTLSLAMSLSEEVSERAIPYLEAWQGFCDEYAPKWDMIESPLCSPAYGLAGTPDRVGVLKGLGLCIVEIKTSKNSAELPFWYLQTAGYKLLLGKASPLFGQAKRKIVHLLPNGQFIMIDCPNTEADMGCFKAQLMVLSYLRNYGVIV